MANYKRDVMRDSRRQWMGVSWIIGAALLAGLVPNILLGWPPPAPRLEKASDILEKIGYRIVESFEVYRRNIPEWRAIDLEAVGVLSVKSAFPVTVGRPIYYRFTFKEEIFANTGAATRRRDERMLKKRESSISQSKDFGVMRMFRIGEALYTIGTDVVMFKAELDRLTAGIQRLLKLEAFEGNDCNPVKPVHDSRQRIVEELRRPVNERLTIALVQQALNERSYDAGNADGRMGPLTRRALSNFQRVNGLAVTGGTIDSAVINALTIPKDPISHYLTQAASAQ